MKYSLLGLGVLFGVALDQWLKFWAKNNLDSPITIIEGYFRLLYAENTGIAFSLPVAHSILIPLSVLVLGFLTWTLVTEKNMSKLRYMSFVMILIGAIGNLIDRIFFGFVTDFISVMSFPIFNLADMFISVGVILFISDEVFGS